MENWRRGDIHGEWKPSSYDIVSLFGSYMNASVAQMMEELYGGDDTMRLHMTTNNAIAFNYKYRKKLVDQMVSLPWDMNMLGAFHKLHFILYMADKNPDFDETICDGPHTFSMDVPGRDIWILELIYKAATECLRDNFIKASKATDKKYKYRISTLYCQRDMGIELYVTDDYYVDLWVSFEPVVNKNGTFGCKHKVSMSGWYTGGGGKFQLTRNMAKKEPLVDSMLRMKSYITDELKKFSRILRKADFNTPEYALCKINGGCICK
jgi:hypothetical protein